MPLCSPQFQQRVSNCLILQAAFSDGVLWVDFRNKLDPEGLLLRERLQDLLADLTPSGEDLPPPGAETGALEKLLGYKLAGRRFLLVLDNLHAHEQGQPLQMACHAIDGKQWYALRKT